MFEEPENEAGAQDEIEEVGNRADGCGADDIFSEATSKDSSPICFCV